MNEATTRAASRDAEPVPVPLQPIVVTTVVPCEPLRAFDYFTRDIGCWWPLARHSCGGERAQDVRLEPHVRGGILETTRDGTVHRWGTVTEWAPGARVAFSWHPGRDEATAQWVRVTFEATRGGTRVTLTHGGFEALGDDAQRLHAGYASGWPPVLSGSYAAYCTRTGANPN